jgi:hypothetical protein
MATAEENAYDKLIEKLLDAANEVREDKLFGTTLAMQAMIDYLQAIGAPRETLVPFGEAFILLAEAAFAKDHIGKSGPKHQKLGKLASLSAAAAAVTIIKDINGCLVSDAVRQVSRATGIDSNELKKFRDALHRGTAHRLADLHYQGHLETIRPMTAAQRDAFLVSVKRLHRLYL